MQRFNTEEIQEFETAHAARLRKLAPECMVLLKSNGDFPLANTGKIALFGGGVRRTIKGGTGSGDVNVRHFTTVEEGFENAGFTVTTKSWLDSYGDIIETAHKQFVIDLKEKAKASGVPSFVMAMGASMPEPDYDLSLEGDADVCLYVLSRNSGEGSDRQQVAGDINLTETEIKDIKALSHKYKKFMLVLNVGGVVDVSSVPDVDNILVMSQLGTVSGDALADTVLGKTYPSGKLSTTWAPIKEYPSTEGFADPNDTRYKEGIYVGYRYFDTAGVSPYFPFGFGLGYTRFEIEFSAFSVEGHSIKVTASVKNVGKVPGKEVVQLYYSAPEGSLDKPFQELAAYTKTVELAPGAAQDVELCFDAADMASYDIVKASYLLEKGLYYVRVGNSSRNTHIAGAIEVTEEIITQKLMNVGGSPDFEDLKITAPSFSYTEEAEEKASAKVVKLDSKSIKTDVVNYSSAPVPLDGNGCSFEDVKNGKAALDDFVAGLTNDELAYFCIGDYPDGAMAGSFVGNAATTVAGAAGETSCRMKNKGVLPLVMADGPAGLRLSTTYTLSDEGALPSGATLPADMFDLMDEASMKMLGIDPESLDVKAEDIAGEKYYQYCTAIPIGTALAQSWNDSLCKDCGDLIGAEMELFGVHLWLAPAHNIHRSPLCGRNFEYLSEDPLLSGYIAAALTNGVQAHKGCGTTIKHFCCNNQETNRYFSNSVLSERALREIYLKSFEVCVRHSMPHSVMTSYNLVNGEHACNRKDIMTYVLRDEWKFDGFVMTDWLVTGGMGPKGEKYPCASAAGNIKAGNDVTMPGMTSDKEDIMAAIDNPEHNYPLSRADLQLAAKRVIQLVLKLV
ncbi:MAG: glycoside hydrolase family 3 N-terminal domain-containing protein [Spirochaetales bacterium]|nr:glycoside hydrolase family 3 N-terminal domain-containing protein [Spirochaetales bacterium]